VKIWQQRPLEALQSFERKWDRKYPSISKSWRAHWLELITFLKYPAEICKVTEAVFQCASSYAAESNARRFADEGSGIGEESLRRA
jgi:transposase-like protein